MKNLLKISVLLMIISMSCSKEDTDNIEILQNKTLTFEEFFDKVSSMNMNTSKEESIYIDYTWNKKDKSITINSFEEKETSWGAAFVIAGIGNDSNSQMRSNGNGYTVYCANGKNSWTKDCSGKWSCGSAVIDCLDQGGCAEICKKRMEYYPDKKIFFLDVEDAEMTKKNIKKIRG